VELFECITWPVASADAPATVRSGLRMDVGARLRGMFKPAG
jgi:hypothetical protein